MVKDQKWEYKGCKLEIKMVEEDDGSEDDGSDDNGSTRYIETAWYSVDFAGNIMYPNLPIFSPKKEYLEKWVDENLGNSL